MFTILFNTSQWHELKIGEEEKIKREVLAFPQNRILADSIDSICDYFVQKYTLEVPKLIKEGMNVEWNEKSISIQVPNSQSEFQTDGIQVLVHIPFSGDRNLFVIRPSTFSYDPPRAKIGQTELTIPFVVQNFEFENLKNLVESELSKIELWLSRLQANADTFNQSLASYSRSLLQARKDKLLRTHNMVASLGYPLKSRAEGTTYTPPEIRKKLKPTLTPISTVPFAPEPAISLDDYEHILKVMQNMTIVMEQSPSAFTSIDEESLRTHFLVQLNGHYEGQATGETFNYQGKTDILIKVQGKNIFVAECKFWNGPAMLTQTIDQLLSYSSWRDTKSALVIFNRKKNFSAVLDQIEPTFKKHSNFRRRLSIQGDTRFRYVLHHKDDPSREITVTVLAFDVPTPFNP